jgi:hypothetical protein
MVRLSHNKARLELFFSIGTELILLYRCIHMHNFRRVLLRASKVCLSRPGFFLAQTNRNANSQQTTDTQVKYAPLAELAPLSSNTLIASTYDTLLAPLLTLFTDNLSSVTFLIKCSLHRYTFHALSALFAITMTQSRWETVLATPGREGDNHQCQWPRKPAYPIRVAAALPPL